MLHAGLDLSRKRLDVHLVDEAGTTVEVGAVLPDRDGLRSLVGRTARYHQPVRAVIELMTGARFVHDQLALLGGRWRSRMRAGQGLAPLACKTDKIDAAVLAQLSRRDLVPAVWLPTPQVRAERERVRWRLHLVHHRVGLKNRVRAILITFGQQRPMADLFGASGRRLLDQLDPPRLAGTLLASVRLIDELDREIDACDAALRRLGAEHPAVPLLMTAPGIGWVLASTIAGEIGDIRRFPSPKSLRGYTGLCPRVYQSGTKDRRGALAKNGPNYLRWALIEAAAHAAHHPADSAHYEATKKRLGRQRGAVVARIEAGAASSPRAIWSHAPRHQAFSPAGPATRLVA